MYAELLFELIRNRPTIQARRGVYGAAAVNCTELIILDLPNPLFGGEVGLIAVEFPSMMNMAIPVFL
jgi:hypothetical protein